jgi:hypothetical protein
LLDLVRPQGSCLPLAGVGWPVPEGSRDGWWDGLPYPLYDMSPQGYMGRQLARAEHRQLGVSPNPQEWGDDDIAWVLSRSGSDVSGNQILGDRAFEHWQATKLAPPEPLHTRALGAAYARLAKHAIGAGVAGSSHVCGHHCSREGIQLRRIGWVDIRWQPRNVMIEDRRITVVDRLV